MNVRYGGMTFTRWFVLQCLLFLLGVGFFVGQATPIIAQQPSPSKSRQLPLRPYSLSQKEIQAFAEKLKQLDADELTKSLIEKITQEIKANPNASREEIAKKVLADFGEFTPAQILQLKQFVESKQKLSDEQPSSETNRSRKKSDRSNSPARPVPQPFDEQPSSNPESARPRPPETPELPPPPDGKSAAPKAPAKEQLPSPTNDIPPESEIRIFAFSLNSESMPDRSVDPKRLKNYQSVAKFWEQNLGSLNDTPAVKRLLFEMLTGHSNTGATDNGMARFIESLSKDSKSPSTLKSLFSSIEPASVTPQDAPNEKWNLFELAKQFGQNLEKTSRDGSESLERSARSGSLGSMPAFDIRNLILIACGVGVLALAWKLYRKYTPAMMNETRRHRTRLVDPRTITDQHSLIASFEGICRNLHGPDAEHWNHAVLRNEIEKLAVLGERDINDLISAYVLARYSSDPNTLQTADIERARSILCRLAGVSPS